MYLKIKVLNKEITLLKQYEKSLVFLTSIVKVVRMGEESTLRFSSPFLVFYLACNIYLYIR